MTSVKEIQDELKRALSIAFICGDKDGYIDCCYNKNAKRNIYHLRYGTDEYDIDDENDVFTFPFIRGKSLSEVFRDVEIKLC